MALLPLVDCIKGLVSRSLTDSYIGCDYFLLKLPLSKVPLVGPVWFKWYWQVNTRYEMNDIAVLP